MNAYPIVLTVAALAGPVVLVDPGGTPAEIAQAIRDAAVTTDPFVLHIGDPDGEAPPSGGQTVTLDSEGIAGLRVEYLPDGETGPGPMPRGWLKQIQGGHR